MKRLAVLPIIFGLSILACLSSAGEGDLPLTSHLISSPSENFQQAGIYMIVAPDTYVSILNAFCGPCLPETGGTGIFMEAFIAGEYKAGGLLVGHPAGETDFYLRLTYSAAAQTVTGEFAREPDVWLPVGTISGVSQVQYYGMGAANSPGEEGTQSDLTAFFDYIEVSDGPVPVRTPAALPAGAPDPSGLVHG